MSTQELTPPPHDLETDDTSEALWRAIAFTTDHGSVYAYDEDGKTTRFKTATGEQHVRQDVTVFVDLDIEGEQDFLDAYRMKNLAHPTKVYILERLEDDSAVKVRDVDQVKDPGNLYLSIVQDGQIVKNVKASLDPFVGANVFDTRHYQEDGKWMTERHLGNKVTEIKYEA